MGSRYLKERERAVAFQVFSFTIPYDNILLSSDLGIGGRPYTIPLLNHFGYFQINIGKKFSWELLMHELTHVWQGYNSLLSWGYVLESLFAQMVCGDAYAYKVGFDWDQYNVEQQASIVEDWYKKGRSKKDPRYRYIRDCIWHPERNRATVDDFSHVQI